MWNSNDTNCFQAAKRKWEKHNFGISWEKIGAIWMQMKIVVKDFTASLPIWKAALHMDWDLHMTHPKIMRIFSKFILFSASPMPKAGQYVQLSIYLATGGPTKENWSHVPSSDELCWNSLVDFQINQLHWNSDQKKWRLKVITRSDDADQWKPI